MKSQASLGLLLTTFALQSSLALSAQETCVQIDPTNKDVDGMPLCPNIVQSSPLNAWAVFSCAYGQGKKFHPPTNNEKSEINILLQTFKQSLKTGISADTTATMLESADALDLQACRVRQTKKENNIAIDDSYLLFYTKKGVANYSGPFMMLRETHPSKVIIIGPHDDSDGTYASTKDGLAFSNALACISNGFKRAATVGTDRTDRRASDFVHSTNNLGTYVVTQMGRLFPASVVLHIHGMKDKTKVMYNARNKVLGQAFESAIIKNTWIKSNAFVGLPVDFTIDKLVNTNWYVKTEIPAVMHSNSPMFLSKVIQDLEKNSWAWPTPADQPDAPESHLEKTQTTK